MILFAAIFADTVDLESVAGGEVVILLADLLFQLTNLLRKKFHRTAAFRANHVMVAAPVVLMFVASDAIMKGHFTGKTALG